MNTIDAQEQREIIHWTDEHTWLKARSVDITSTEAASLFGHGRETPFELACRKGGKTESRFEPNERTEIGKEIEHAIAIRAARLYGVNIRHKNEYIRIHSARMGASFDYEVTGVADSQIEDNRLRLIFGSMGPGLMEIKNVDSLQFKNTWNAGQEAEPPPHIDIQLQHQLEVSEFQWGAIIAFVGGNHIEMILRLRDLAVGGSIRKRIKSFWNNLEREIYPPVTYPGDIDVLKQIYCHGEPGSVFDARGNDAILAWAERYIQAQKDEKLAKDRKDTAQGQLLGMIGDAERVICDKGITISCGDIGPCDISYRREGYRNWRVTQKKAKT